MNAIRRVVAIIASVAFLALGGVILAAPAQAQARGTGAPSGVSLEDVASDVSGLVGAPISL
ncbi:MULTISPECIES: hypothetical protein [unclassified Streptomyces]|uniref:hypothetical protein n=1 Tax=unclassified Streptomyces TaxID=2593676 RepID=UPI00404270A5